MEKCKNLNIDFGFIVDTSTKAKADIQKQFATLVAKKFAITEDATHTSVVTMADTANLRIKFSEDNEYSDFNEAVSKIQTEQV